MTIAFVPSGEKYRLYGSSIGMSVPGLPLRGSIGVSVLPLLLFTYSVCMSQDGTTCCGSAFTGNWSITAIEFGSMTLTVFDIEFGTYTRVGMSRTDGASWFAC